MKSLKAYSALALAFASAGVLALSLHGCASGPEGPIPPTVAVKITSVPEGGRININGDELGEVPLTANLEVGSDGTTVYPITIRFTSTSAGGKGGGGKGGNSVTYPPGKLLPATLTFAPNGTSSESRDSAPHNPPGTKPSAERAL